MNITDKFYYKSDLLNLLELDEYTKYSLWYIYFKFKDLLSDKTYKKIFQTYTNIDLIMYDNLEKENKLIDYILKNFTLKYKFISIDKGNIIKNITI